MVVFFILGINLFITSKNNAEPFNNSSPRIKIRNQGNPILTLEPNQCLVRIYIPINKQYELQTELNKMIKTYANAPINAFGKNRIINPDKRLSLFANHIIKFDNVIGVATNTGMMNSNLENDELRISAQETEPCIYFITAKNSYKVLNVFSPTDTVYYIVLKIKAFIGLENNYQ